MANVTESESKSKEQPQGLADVRALLLKSESRKRLPIVYKGVDLELIQPTIGEIEEMRKESVEGSTSLDGFLRIMIKFTVLPGTNTHPLTEEDAPELRTHPWNKAATTIVETFGKLSDIDVSGEAKNSEETAS